MIGMVIVDFHTYLNRCHLLCVNVLLVSLLLPLVLLLCFKKCIVLLKLLLQPLHIHVVRGAVLPAATTT